MKRKSLVLVNVEEVFVFSSVNIVQRDLYVFIADPAGWITISIIMIWIVDSVFAKTQQQHVLHADLSYRYAELSEFPVEFAILPRIHLDDHQAWYYVCPIANRTKLVQGSIPVPVGYPTIGMHACMHACYAVFATTTTDCQP
jgi:hypothetical protein